MVCPAHIPSKNIHRSTKKQTTTNPDIPRHPSSIRKGFGFCSVSVRFFRKNIPPTRYASRAGSATSRHGDYEGISTLVVTGERCNKRAWKRYSSIRHQVTCSPVLSGRSVSGRCAPLSLLPGRVPNGHRSACGHRSAPCVYCKIRGIDRPVQ